MSLLEKVISQLFLLEIEMVRFKTFIELKEGSYPKWVKFVVGGLVMKLNNLKNQINNEKDPQKQNILISKQNTLLGVISGMGIGVNTNDPQLMNRLKSFRNK